MQVSVTPTTHDARATTEPRETAAQAGFAGIFMAILDGTSPGRVGPQAREGAGETPEENPRDDAETGDEASTITDDATSVELADIPREIMSDLPALVSMVTMPEGGDVSAQDDAPDARIPSDGPDGSGAATRAPLRAEAPDARVVTGTAPSGLEADDPAPALSSIPNQEAGARPPPERIALPDTREAGVATNLAAPGRPVGATISSPEKAPAFPGGDGRTAPTDTAAPSPGLTTERGAGPALSDTTALASLPGLARPVAPAGPVAQAEASRVRTGPAIADTPGPALTPAATGQAPSRADFGPDALPELPRTPEVAAAETAQASTETADQARRPKDGATPAATTPETGMIAPGEPAREGPAAREAGPERVRALPLTRENPGRGEVVETGRAEDARPRAEPVTPAKPAEQEVAPPDWLQGDAAQAAPEVTRAAPAAHEPVASRLRSPLARSVAEQISGDLAARGEDERRTIVRLRPRGMGLVEIEMSRDEAGRTIAAIRVQNPLVLDALRAERAIVADIVGQGVRQESVSMDLLGTPDRGAENGGQGERRPNGRAATAATENADDPPAGQKPDAGLLV